jgi:hypothetical protein
VSKNVTISLGLCIAMNFSACEVMSVSFTDCVLEVWIDPHPSNVFIL